MSTQADNNDAEPVEEGGRIEGIKGDAKSLYSMQLSTEQKLPEGLHLYLPGYLQGCWRCIMSFI